jgi:hypothetical protein
VTIGPDDVHPNFAGRVAAQDAAILDEDDANSLTRGGDGGADPRDSAPGD